VLSLLLIKNFALIQNMELEPSPGFTVLSGETGAGKSIILSALNLILGAKAGTDLIRQGEETATVEALFHLSAREAALLPETAGPEADLLLKRVVSREGRNRVQINGGLSTLNALLASSSPLVSLCGQHGQQSLLKAEEHLSLLDAFAGQSETCRRQALAFKEISELERRIARKREELSRRQEEDERLKQAIAELEEAGLRSGEEEELKGEYSLLRNAGQRAGLSQSAYMHLYGTEKGNVLAGLKKALNALRDLAGLDGSLAPAARSAEDCYYTLEDLAYSLRDYSARAGDEPGRLERLEERMNLLQRLARRYGGSVDSALAYLEKARRELAGRRESREDLERLGAARETAVKAAAEQAEKLRAARREASERLARQVEEELEDLGMGSCRFEVRFPPPGGMTVDSPAGPLGSLGLEGAEFYMAPNPGEGFRPLAHTASGGELSRLLLALRGISARQMGSPTLIFDEVDAGIGGDMGLKVGRKLARLAVGAQVVCITHLPQIAAFADRHYRVSKLVSEGRTSSNLLRLDGEAREEELSRMLGAGESARRHAQDLLRLAEEENQRFRQGS
jgi:DNA repair protein RecN (Recombination protein N)